MTSPPMRRHDLLRMAAAQLAQAEAARAVPPDTTTAAPTPSFIPAHARLKARQRPALPPLLRWASRIDAWPPALWMSLQALALWPVLRWAVQRFASETHTLPALLALVLLAVCAARGRLSCDWPARPGWLAGSAVLSLAINASIGVLSWPALAGASALAAGCSWAAFRKPGMPVLPVLGLLALALPLDLVDPLRVFSSDGIFVLPVWLLWLAGNTACAAALWNRLHDLRFLARLPGSAMTAVAGTVIQIGALLNWPFVDGQPTEDSWKAAHAVLTLATGAAACAMVVHLMRGEVKHAAR